MCGVGWMVIRHLRPEGQQAGLSPIRKFLGVEGGCKLGQAPLCVGALAAALGCPRAWILSSALWGWWHEGVVSSAPPGHPLGSSLRARHAPRSLNDGGSLTLAASRRVCGVGWSLGRPATRGSAGRAESHCDQPAPPRVELVASPQHPRVGGVWEACASTAFDERTASV